jgi:hypothetical protein
MGRPSHGKFRNLSKIERQPVVPSCSADKANDWPAFRPPFPFPEKIEFLEGSEDMCLAVLIPNFPRLSHRKSQLAPKMLV